ncbi:MAG TPA: hypothetical protein VH253_07230 [Phycisphaerae bacterium]|nr:hypothetical protein [Phycisphaerae bacterium]
MTYAINGILSGRRGGVGEAGPRKLAWWMYLLLALAAVGVYANSLKNGFALDDVAIIQQNAHVTDLHWAEIWTDNYWPKEDGVPPDVLYRPLTIWTYLVNEWMSPGGTFGYHLFNVLAHALATVMVAALAWRLFGSRAVAVVTGALFALHPLHTEVVANTVGRAEILAAIFSLAALLVYLPDWGVFGEVRLQRRGWWHGPIVAACFFAAMLCKETPVTLMVAFVFIDVWMWCRADKSGRPGIWRWLRGRAVRYYLPVGVLFGVYLAMRVHACGLMQALHQTHPIVNPLVKATIPERLVTPFVLFAKYLALTAWPRLLLADYSAPSLMPTANPFAPLALSGIVIAALIVWAMVRWWRSRPQVVLVLALFICAYGLIANLLLRIGTIFGERLFYWPSVFVLMLAAYAAVRAYEALQGMSWRRAGRIAMGCAAAVAAVLMCVRTVTRNTDWQGNIPLSIASARDNLGSAKTCYWAGMTMVTDGPEPWMQEFGADLLKRAVKLYPGFGDSYFELAKYYGRQQKLATSLYYLGKAAENEPGSQQVRFAIGSVERDLGSRKEESYMPELEACVREHASDGPSEFIVALAYVGQKKWDLAKAQCEKVLKAEPHFHEAGALLAVIEHETGHGEEAVTTLRTYVMNVPFALDARCLLAQYLMEEDAAKHPHALDEAAMNLDKAAQLGDVPAIRGLRGELSKKRASARATGESGRVAAAEGRVRP